jgi:hypothetical protein
LVDALRQAEQAAAEDAGAIAGHLAAVDLEYGGLSRWRTGGAAVVEIGRLRSGREQRLDMARQVAESRGWSTPTVLLNDLGLAWTEADRAAALMAQVAADGLGDGWPLELTDLLAAGASDPAFQDELARRLSSAADMAGFLAKVYARQADLAVAGDPGLDDFLAREGQVLDGLGSALSAAAGRLAAAGLESFTAEWRKIIESGLPHGGLPAMLSLVIERGSWPDEFLTGMKDAIEAGGSAGDPGVNWRPDFGPVFDPGSARPDGSPVQVSDPMRGVWLAAVLNPMRGVWLAAVLNPQWFWRSIRARSRSRSSTTRRTPVANRWRPRSTRWARRTRGCWT